jgi:hydroxyacylglutathione hydrolase
MILKQYYLACLAHASYLIADEKTKTAVIVDPQRDIQQYLRDAAQGGFKITHVFLTHFHADFLAGHIELRNQAGAQIVMGASAQADFPFLAMRDGETLSMGDVRIKVLETPGHTPEGISLLIYDGMKSLDAPAAVLTGDTLFIGDVGRPDLLASIGVTADQLAQMLYHSLAKLRALPDATLVYPAHGAGSMCGKNLSSQTVSTIGQQKRENYALQSMSLVDFKNLVTEDQPEAPEYFIYDATRNRQERPDLAATLHTSLKALSVQEVLGLQRRGAQLLDVREGAEFEAAHMTGALNIGLKGKYATWCGSLLSHEKPIVVIADQGAEEEAVTRLGRIGFDNVAGFLSLGMNALDAHPHLIGDIPRATALAISQQLTSPTPPLILDVRSEKEWRSGHIPGSTNIPLTHLAEKIAQLPTDRPLVVHCEGGYRSAIAASILARAGLSHLTDLIGGIKAWAASSLPTDPQGAIHAACSLNAKR